MSSRNIREDSLAERKRQIDENPCFAEQHKSLKCVELNSRDSDIGCEREINNYKMCQTFWYEIHRFRKQNGIYPYIPEPQERAHMKRIYMNTGSVKPIIAEMKRQYDL